MALNFVFLRSLIVLALVDRAFPVPAPIPDSKTSGLEELESKLVEIKLPVKITSMEDLIAWARNAMRSMASRIDITLAAVDDPVAPNRQHFNSSETRTKQREPNFDKGRPVSSDALVSTFASLFGPENSFASLLQGQGDLAKRGSPHGENELIRDVLPRTNLNAYLPVLLDDAELAKYREEALRKFYWSNEEAKRDKSQKGSQEKSGGKYSQTIGAQSSRVSIGNGETKSSSTKSGKDETKKGPVISVPFEAIVTITRENLNEPPRANFVEIRDPPDEFPPYFNKDYSRPESSEKLEKNPGKRIKDNSQKRQIATIGDLLRMLGLTKKITNMKIKQFDTSQSNRPRKPSEKFTPPPKFQFEDQSQRQRRNETSQRQEFDDEDEEEEEPMGSLGSITDLLPLVIPILEDISDPNTETDLGEVLNAAIPLLEGLFEPSDDPDAPDIIGMIGPILTKIVGGKDGQGSDVAAILGPLLGLIAPLIGPVLGPLIGPLLSTISNPPQGEGSSLASLLSAVLGPLIQPTEKGGMSPLTVFTAGLVGALSKELKPGLPGGLDVGAIVGAVLSGVIAGASAGLSGGLGDKHSYQPYGPPYGPAYGVGGPVQAGSVNTRTSTGYVVPGSQKNHRVNVVPGKIVNHPTVVHHPTHRPYSTLPQGIPHGPQPRPPPPTYVQHVQATGPLPAGTSTGADGSSSYLPYGTNNAVPASSVNPIGLVTMAIKDILGAGINVVSSVINAIFGIIGGSSSEEPRPVYGPPPAHSSYNQPPR